MAGEVRIGGTSASVNLQGNDDITDDQTFTFPDTGGEMVVTPGTADIETTGSITVGEGADWAPAGVGVRRSDSNWGIIVAHDKSQDTASALLIASGTTPIAGSPLTIQVNQSGLDGTGTTDVFKVDWNGSITAAGDCTFGPQVKINGQTSTSANVFIQYAGEGNKEVFLTKGDGTTYIGGTNLSTGSPDPNIRLSADGSAEFGKYVQMITNGRTQDESPLLLQNTDNSGYCLVSKNGNNVTAYIEASGKIWGSNVTFMLDPDNPDSWKVTQEKYQEDVTGPLGKIEKTVTKTREVREYIGKTLDVRQTLESLLERAAKQDETIADLTRQLTELKGAKS